MTNELNPKKWMLNSRAEAEEFMAIQFPEYDPNRVIAAFSHAFFDGHHEWTVDKRTSTKAINQIRRQASQADGQEAKELQEHADCSEVWHRNYPKKGGQDPADYILADWVKMGFEDLGADITFGISKTAQGEPSTRFGRMVQAVLAFRKSTANWRRVAQRTVNANGPMN